jgi:hypothetical protein
MVEYFTERTGARQVSAEDELNALDHHLSQTTQVEAARCFAEVLRADNPLFREADVKANDTAIFSNSEPCAALIGDVVIAYFAVYDGSGFVERIIVLGANTGYPPDNQTWRAEMLRRLALHRSGGIP